MQSYGQFGVFPLSDRLPIWRDRNQDEAIGVAGQRERLHVVRREGDLYCVRIVGFGYGYVRADSVISERDLKTAQQASGRRAAYPGAPAPMSVGGLTPCGFFERLIPFVIDTIILCAAFYAISSLLGLEQPGLRQDAPAQPGASAEIAIAWQETWISLMLNAAYFIGFWSAFAATPGKLLMGQRIVDAETGDPISAGSATIRYLVSIPSALALYIGYLWMIWDDKKQTWHDKISGTIVIEA